MAHGWILRGSKVDRILGAVLLDGALGALSAWKSGRDPLLRGVLEAIGGAQAMSQHRLTHRARAHERNGKIAEVLAQVLERAKEASQRPKMLSPNVVRSDRSAWSF